MASKNDARDKLVSGLKSSRDEHRRLSKKIARTRAKLEKRTAKLRSLESQIATLERGAHPAKTGRRGPSPSPKKNLRPAFLIYNPESSGNKSQAHKLKTILEKLAAHGIRATVGAESSGRTARTLAK